MRPDNKLLHKDGEVSFADTGPTDKDTLEPHNKNQAVAYFTANDNGRRIASISNSSRADNDETKNPKDLPCFPHRDEKGKYPFGARCKYSHDLSSPFPSTNIAWMALATTALCGNYILAQNLSMKKRPKRLFFHVYKRSSGSKANSSRPRSYEEGTRNGVFEVGEFPIKQGKTRQGNFILSCFVLLCLVLSCLGLSCFVALLCCLALLPCSVVWLCCHAL